MMFVRYMIYLNWFDLIFMSFFLGFFFSLFESLLLWFHWWIELNHLQFIIIVVDNDKNFVQSFVIARKYNIFHWISMMMMMMWYVTNSIFLLVFFVYRQSINRSIDRAKQQQQKQFSKSNKLWWTTKKERVISTTTTKWSNLRPQQCDKSIFCLFCFFTLKKQILSLYHGWKWSFIKWKSSW